MYPRVVFLDHSFLLYTNVSPITLENVLVGCAGDSTLLAEVPGPGDKASIVESLNRDLLSINE